MDRKLVLVFGNISLQDIQRAIRYFNMQISSDTDGTFKIVDYTIKDLRYK